MKKVNLSEPVHPFIRWVQMCCLVRSQWPWGAELHLLCRRSVNVVEKYFEAYALQGQDVLGSPERWDKVLALVPEGILPAALLRVGSGVRIGCWP